MEQNRTDLASPESEREREAPSPLQAEESRMEQNRTDLASPESVIQRGLYKQRRMEWNRTERICPVQRARGPKSFTSRGE